MTERTDKRPNGIWTDDDGAWFEVCDPKGVTHHFGPFHPTEEGCQSNGAELALKALLANGWSLAGFSRVERRMTERTHRRIFCLLTERGTACAGTGLCEDHDSSANRDRVEREVSRDSDRPAPGSWTDCGQNPEAQCRVCGERGTDDDIFGEVELTQFSRNAEGDWPENTCYLYELSDGDLFEDAEGNQFNRVGYGPVQGSIQIVDDDEVNAYWDVTTRVRRAE